MIFVVSRDQLPYIMITWSTAVYNEKYTAPCYRVEYTNSERINMASVRQDYMYNPASCWDRHDETLVDPFGDSITFLDGPKVSYSRFTKCGRLQTFWYNYILSGRDRF